MTTMMPTAITTADPPPSPPLPLASATGAAAVGVELDVGEGASVGRSVPLTGVELVDNVGARLVGGRLADTCVGLAGEDGASVGARVAGTSVGVATGEAAVGCETVGARLVLDVGAAVGARLRGAKVTGIVGAAVGWHVPGLQLHSVAPIWYALVSQAQRTKANGSSDWSDGEMDTEPSEVHARKAALSIMVTEDGMSIVLRALQLLNANESILTTEAGIATVRRSLQCWSIPRLMTCSESGRVMKASEVHPANASGPMLLTELETTTACNDVHP